jgi:hypothetical protein
MNAEAAADFLRLSPTAFRKPAPSLPRCQIYERSGYRYLRSDLLAWLRLRGNAAEPRPHLETLGGTKTRKALPERGVKRLIQSGIPEWRDPDSNRGHHDFQSYAEAFRYVVNPYG